MRYRQNGKQGMWLLVVLVACQASVLSANPPASPPMKEEISTTEPTPLESEQIQERAIRHGAGEMGQCVCMRPVGQCVFSAQGGCVSHRGNLCNGGCIVRESTPGIGGLAPASKGGGAQRPAGPGSMAK